MIFTGIRLTNFKCYRGVQELVLGPGVHAITAEREGDARRSNYQGKTTFLFAVRFLLTGKHGEETEDAWITDGEKDGAVDGEFTDGTYAIRERVRGESTQLKVIRPNGDGTERELRGDLAQEELDRMTGGTSKEHLATWWGGQKQTDFFTTAEPAELTELVVRWVGLESVREAWDIVRSSLTNALTAQNADEIAAQNEQRVLGAYVKSELEGKLRAAEANMQATADLIAADKNAEAEQVRLRNLERDAVEYDRSFERAKVIKSTRVEVTEEALRESTKKLNERRDTMRKAKQELDANEKLVRGEFSGVCPVNACACPIKDEINADNARAVQQRDTTKSLYESARNKHDAANTTDALLRDQSRVSAHLLGELQQLTSMMVRLGPSATEWKRIKAGDTDPHVTHASVGQVLDLQATMRADRETHQLAERELAKYALAEHRKSEAEEMMAVRRPSIIAHREACALLGPAGVQRRLARGMLDEVEDQAAMMLADAGIDLSVSFEWERETKQPNDACDVCGNQFPKSTKVKQCTECGADRGLKKEQRLRVVVKPKSGGADDFAGFIGRFAVATWLRRKRSSDWGVLCLDEPFASLDLYNRQAMTQLLLAAARVAGFEQVFVVAHDRASLDALPCRVMITGHEGGSKIRMG